MAAKQLKEQGNRLYAQGKVEAALEVYSQAIAASPSQAVLYSNRALCHCKLKRWSDVVTDCGRAIELDPSLVKAHFLLGQAMCEAGAYDDAISSLTTAYQLAREQGKNFGDDIASTIRIAKRQRWQRMEEQRLAEESVFQSFLLEQLNDHQTRQMDNIESSDPSYADREREHEERVQKLQELFITADSNRKRREVPEYLIGKISFELMRDPVIAPSGITYDKMDIEDHLERVGHFDPLTREPLTKDKLIPNYALKEVLDAFLSENAWVKEY